MMKRAFQIGTTPLNRPPYYGLVSPGVASVHDLAVAGDETVRPMLREAGQWMGWGTAAYVGVAPNTNSTNNLPAPCSLPGNGTLVRQTWPAGSANGAVSGYLDSAGAAYFFGANGTGRFGNGNTTNSTTAWVATTMPAGVTFVDLATANTTSHAIDSDGNLWGWGAQNTVGNGLTSGNQLTPILVGTKKWKRVWGNGQGAVAAIDDADDLYMWGSNAQYQTGLGVNTGVTNVPTKVGSLKWREVSLCGSGGIGLTLDGKIYSWGIDSSTYPYLGSGLSGNQTRTTPTAIAAVSARTFVEVSCQGNPSASTGAIALEDNGDVWTWGVAAANPDNLVSNAPKKVLSGKFRTVSQGGMTACAIDLGDRLWFWGAASSAGTGTINVSPITATIQGAEVVASGVDRVIMNAGTMVKLK